MSDDKKHVAAFSRETLSLLTELCRKKPSLRDIDLFFRILHKNSLVLSPIFSYSDQIISIHKTKNLGGFSMDIPLIMLVASILKYVLRTARFAFLFESLRDSNKKISILPY